MELSFDKCTRLDNCKFIDFPKIHDYRGNLSVIEGNNQIPFEIKRIFFLYDVPSGERRGGHAHKTLEQIIIALSGSFDVTLDDGFAKKTVFLNRPHYGLYVAPGTWTEIGNFSSNSIALSVVSQAFNESDYIRDYETFVRMVRDGNWREE